MWKHLLTCRTNELISRVAAANPNTVVVLQAGSAVALPWVSSVKTVLHAWYLGNECGLAIANILYGNTNPSGRLPLSMPKREADIASYADFKSARTKVHYTEGVWVGYKWHNMRSIEPLFPFGHGLSYTTFAYSDFSIEVESTGSDADSWRLNLQVTIHNTGKRIGDHSVHFYLSPPPETTQSLKHPQHSLQGFDKLYDIKPQEPRQSHMVLDKCEIHPVRPYSSSHTDAISHWDELTDQWLVERGTWTVYVGADGQTFELPQTFNVDEKIAWRGL